MTDVSSGANKMDPIMQADHIGRITRVYQEANISVTVGPMHNPNLQLIPRKSKYSEVGYGRIIPLTID